MYTSALTSDIISVCWLHPLKITHDLCVVDWFCHVPGVKAQQMVCRVSVHSGLIVERFRKHETFIVVFVSLQSAHYRQAVASMPILLTALTNFLFHINLRTY